MLSSSISAEETQPYFDLHLLVNSSKDSRVAFVTAMIEDLSSLNIDIITHPAQGSSFFDRNLYYLLINPEAEFIPTYEEGGYDVAIAGSLWELDPNDFSWMFGFAPEESYFQYNSSEFYETLNQYFIEPDPYLRTSLLNNLQSILYNEVPSIPLYYEQFLMTKRNEFSGISSNILLEGPLQAENWQNSNDSKTTIAVPWFPNSYSIFDFHPYYTRNMFPTALWTQSVYGGLTRRNPNTLYWDLIVANNFSISPDKLQITVDLDPNAKFSDGSPILAEDVKYTYNLHQTISAGSFLYTDLLQVISNNDSVEIIDSDTVKFTFSSIQNYPLSYLSIGLLDKSYVEPVISTYGYSIFNDAPFTSNVTDTLVKSCGPFMLNIFNSTEKTISLTPNPYWNNFTYTSTLNALLDEINIVTVPDIDEALNMLINNEVDLVTDETWNIYPYDLNLNLTFINSHSEIEPLILNTNIVNSMEINMLHPIFGTGELTPEGTPEAANYIRLAISHAINRYAIIQDVFDGVAKQGASIVPDSCAGADIGLLPSAFDLFSSREYLEMAGYGLPTETTNVFVLVTILGFLAIASSYDLNRKRT